MIANITFTIRIFMFSFHIPTISSSLQINLNIGNSVVLLGANGSGKTRLGVQIETTLGSTKNVHRIGAHRSLVMNTNVQPPSYENAENQLLYGFHNGKHEHRNGHRWQGKPATALLNDFDHVVAALYADENNTSVKFRQSHRVNPDVPSPESKLDKLKKLWEGILPHRELIISANSITVKPVRNGSSEYNAAELSDGERVIFYLIGQSLLAKHNSLIIIDEPELHLNKSLVTKLWDSIESVRNDCAFVYLTHDLELAVSRQGATKYAVRNYIHTNDNPKWEIEEIPGNTGISEEIVTKIVGSRQNILFIEGDLSSLDSAIYRRVYHNFTTVSVGNCDSVIHSVASFREHTFLHRLGCAGIIDNDARSADQINYLANIGVFVLPVSEVENLLLLPEPFIQIAKLLGFTEEDANTKLNEIQAFVFTEVEKDIEKIAIYRTKSYLDISLKSIGIKSKDIQTLAQDLTTQLTTINVNEVYNQIITDLKQAIDKKLYEDLLKLVNNKGLLSKAGQIFGFKGRKELEEFIGRNLLNESGKSLLDSLVNILPKIPLDTPKIESQAA